MKKMYVIFGICLVALLVSGQPAMAQQEEGAVQSVSLDTAPVEAAEPAQDVAATPEKSAEGNVAKASELVREIKVTAPPQPVEKQEKGLGRYLKFNGTLQTVIVYRSDYDFDSTPRVYDVNGQTVGILGTFFKPQLTLYPSKNIRMFWEMELGLNLWSRHNPDQYQSGNFDTFRLAHRELYVEGTFFDRWLGFKVGYQFFEDPTRLFMGHWIGAANVTSDLRVGKLTLTAGQLPGQTYEGISMDANNFKHDTFVYGARFDMLVKQWTIAVSLMGMHDSETIGQTLDLLTASARVSAEYGCANFGLDLALQYGKTQNGAAFADETTLAWALQAFAEIKIKRFNIQLNQLILSADDSNDRNARNGAFFYSGKSRSRTLILSEDEIRDQGYNLDEFMAQKRNAFYLVRSGLSLTDLTFSYNLADIFVPALIIGAGFGLEPDNAMGNSRIGIETDLDLELRYKKILSFHIVGGILFPGAAAAAYVNRGDLTAVKNQYMVQSSLSVMF
jgi:hypothetical protein